MKIPVTTYSHPDWDMNLTLKGNDDHKKWLTEDQDASLLKVEEMDEMTEEELRELPEWEG